MPKRGEREEKKATLHLLHGRQSVAISPHFLMASNPEQSPTFSKLLRNGLTNSNSESYHIVIEDTLSPQCRPLSQ